jgi:hypothetical protein
VPEEPDEELIGGLVAGWARREADEVVRSLADRILAVPDANVFLEFEDFASIDWPGLLGAKHVTLVVTHTVLRELDKHKTARDRRRDTAISVTRRLDALFTGQGSVTLPKGVSVVLSDVIVDPAALPPGLEKEYADDLILAGVLKIKEASAPDPIVFVTDDTGARLKARGLGVDALAMPEKFRRQAEPSPDSRELALMKARLPRARLLFDTPNGPSAEATFSVRVPRHPSEADFEAQIAPLRARHEEVLAQMRGETGPPGLAKAMADFAMAVQFGGPPKPEQISAHEQAVRSYLGKYWEYLERRHELEGIVGSTLRLRLLVVNEGRTPAQDCRVLLHFPDVVNVKERPPAEGLRLEPPAAPVPPSPLDWLRGLAIRPDLPDVGDLLRIGRVPLLPDSSVPRIRRGRSIEVDYGPEDVMHGASFAWRLQPVYVVLPEESRPNDLDVPFEVHAANLPEPSKGALKISLQYVEIEPWSLGEDEGGEEEEEDDDES